MIDYENILRILKTVHHRYYHYYMFEQISEEEYNTVAKLIDEIREEVEYER